MAADFALNDEERVLLTEFYERVDATDNEQKVKLLRKHLGEAQVSSSEGALDFDEELMVLERVYIEGMFHNA